MRCTKKLLLFLLILVSFANNVVAKEKVTFSKCVDGDTIKVTIDNEVKTVRMLAVDTPESVHPTKGVEFFGKEASEYTCNIISNASKIELEFDPGSDREDKYDRLLAWVWVDDTLLQDELIKNGYAEVAYLYGDYKYTSLLQDHQKIAEASKIGIWNEEERKEFDANSESVTKKEENNENENINLDNMSVKDIIILAVILALVMVFSKTIKKLKRKLKKMLK